MRPETLPHSQPRRLVLFPYLCLATAVLFPINSSNGATDLPLGSPIVTIYSPREYKAHVENHSLVQSSTGSLYFANAQGILEYDGVEWRRILPDRFQQVFSLAIGAEDRLYVGAFDDIGYIEPDATGSPQFKSLRAKIPLGHRGDQIYREVLVDGRRVLFRTLKALYVWDETTESMAVYDGLDGYSSVFVLRGEIYSTSSDYPLRRLVDGRWVSVAGAERFSTDASRLRRASVGRNGLAYLATPQSGIYTFDGESFQLFSDDPRLTEDSLNVRSLLVLDSLRVALGTSRHGVIVFDTDGRLLQRLDRRHGLSDQNVAAMLEDEQRGVWMVQSKGLTRVQLAYPISCYSQHHGLEGSIHFIEEYRGRLYVATTIGLYVGEKSEDGLETKFRPIEGLPECKSLIPTELGLLVGSMSGLYLVDGYEAETLVEDLDASYLHRMRSQPDKIIAAAYRGLSVLQKRDGSWKLVGESPYVSEPVHGIAEDAKGDLWLKSGSGVTRRVHFSGDEAIVEEFGVEDGLPGSWVGPLSVDGRMVFTSSQGTLYRFDEKARRFVVEHELQYFPVPDPTGFIEFVRDAAGQDWVSRSVGLGNLIPKPEGDYLLGMQHLSEMRDVRATGVLVEESGVLWLGTFDGITRYDPRLAQAVPQGFSIRARSIESLETGQTLYRDGGDEPILPTVLSGGDRSFRLQMASNWLLSPEEVQYQYIMKGVDKTEPEFVRSSIKEYLNLAPGNYVLEVKSRDPLGRPGESLSLPIIVKAPIYMSWPAYIAYLFAAAAIVWLILRYRTRALSKSNQQLRSLVELRTSELEKQSLALEERNAELERRNEKLKELAGKAAEAAEAKTRFLAMMSHEIRTPMNGVMGMCSLLSKTGLSSEQMEFLGSIKSSGDSLLNIIDDILDYTKIEEGKLELESIPFDVVECVESVSSLLGPQANEKSLELYVAVDPGAHRLRMGDPTRIRQVLVNLLGNSIKFTERGHVTARVGDLDDDKGICIEVSDTGIGIEAAKLDTIFEPFFQADVSNLRRFGGTGLGLSICKQIVDHMSGAITVSSKLGMGTRFRVELPCPVAVEDRALWVPGQLEGKRAALFCVEPRTSEVVEDYLAQWGVSVEKLDAASLFLSSSGCCGGCDVAIIEHKLNTFDSVEVVRRFMDVEEDEWGMPIVLLVSRKSEELRSEMQRERSLHVLSKPIVPTRLLKLLKEVIEPWNRPVAQRSELPVATSHAIASRDVFGDLRVLVAEDNRLNQDVAVRLLESLGAMVSLACNGREAVDMYSENGYDLVLMDVQMPQMDGIEATRQLIANSEPGKEPFVYGLSAGVLREERLKCSEVGMVGFIRKPFELDDLVGALRAARERRTAQPMS